MSEIVLADTITKVGESARGKVVLSGSHGGEIAAWMALKAGASAIILNDAGIGKDNAGVSGSDLCQKAGIPYAAIDTMSARIGGAADMMDRGIVSVANDAARALGVETGMAADQAADLMTSATMAAADIPAYEEAREDIDQGPYKPVIVLADSASLVQPEDRGRIIITGSHGGLPGPDPTYALKADGLIGCYNDAGIGMDDAGVTRLPALEERGIAGCVVDAMSARIGDARSTWRDGVISRCNATATRLGAAVGMPLHELIQKISDR